MNPIKAVWHNGQVLLREPVDWPEGTELRIEAVVPHPEPIVLTEDEAKWLAECRIQLRDDGSFVCEMPRISRVGTITLTPLPAQDGHDDP